MKFSVFILLFLFSVSAFAVSSAIQFLGPWASSGTSISYSAGNVGIGSSAPASLLDVAGSARINNALLRGTTSGTITVQPAAVAGTWSMTLPTSGGTNNYYLQTDGAGAASWTDVTTNINSSEASAAANTTCTSATDTPLNSMAITPSVAGNYLVFFNTTVESNNTDAVDTLSLYVDGTLQTSTVRAVVPQFTSGAGLGTGNSSIPMAVAIVDKVTITSALETIQIECKRTAGTMTVHQRNLVIVKVQ